MVLMNETTTEVCKRVLRFAVFATYLGHGIFALRVKTAWIPLLTTFGFSVETAKALLPVIGMLDIAVAFVVLLWPMRIVLMWAALWAMATALSRFISGDPIWEFIERAANWSAPLVLLLLYGWPQTWKDLVQVRANDSLLRFFKSSFAQPNKPPVLPLPVPELQAKATGMQEQHPDIRTVRTPGHTGTLREMPRY